MGNPIGGGFKVFDDFLGESVGIGRLSDASRLSSLKGKILSLALSRADLNALKNQNLLFLRPELITLGKSDTNALPRLSAYRRASGYGASRPVSLLGR